jgi:thiol-disulfide isomerase/thioredoxin
MKKLICLLSIALLTTTVEVSAQKNHMSFSGKITDKNSDTLKLRSRKFSKIIIVKNDGSFADTLKVKKGYYNLFDGKESTTVFLENGFDLKMAVNTKEFDESIKYSGIGAEPNNYLAKYALLIEEIQNNESLYSMPKADFEKKMTAINKNWKLELNKAKKLEPSFIADQIKNIDGFTAYISGSYEKKKYMNEVLAKGKISPKFKNFENNAGGTTSLDDLKGKYVYIDVWATWCGPCKAEIPALKAVEKEFHGKNIAFVSISADKIKAHDTWKKMVKDMDLSGIQLFSDDDFNTSFMKDYQIDAIPRFILIDPKGNIVAADAPRPSDKKLIDLFKELKI